MHYSAALGARHDRTWLFPSARIRIARCNEPLPEASERKCDEYCRYAESFAEDVRNHGNIDPIVKWVQERRARAID